MRKKQTQNKEIGRRIEGEDRQGKRKKRKLERDKHIKGKQKKKKIKVEEKK